MNKMREDPCLRRTVELREDSQKEDGVDLCSSEERSDATYYHTIIIYPESDTK